MPTLPARRYMPPPMRGGSIADLLMQRGAIAARGAERSGQIWGGAVAGLGQLAGQTISRYGEQKATEDAVAQEEREREQRTAAFQEILGDQRVFEDGQYAFTRLSELYEAPQAIQLAQAFQTFGQAQGETDPNKAMEYVPTLAAGFVAADEDARELIRGPLQGWLTNAGLEREGGWESLSPEQFLSVAQSYAAPPEAGGGPLAGLEGPEREAALTDIRDVAAAGRAPTTPRPSLGRIEEESAARARGTASVKMPEGDIDWTKTGEEFLATLPLEQQATVQQLGEYRRRPAASLYRSESGKRLLALVSQFNREYDEKLYGEAQKAIGEFTSGSTHNNIIAINTLSHHLVPFAEAAAALSNNDTQALNRLKNYFLREFGSDVPTNFSALHSLVSDEIANTFKLSGSTDTSIANAGKTVYATESPAQLLGALQRLARLAEGRIRAIGNKYDVTFGDGAFDRKGYISDEARHAYEMIRGAGELGDISEGRTTTGEGLAAVADALAKLNLSPEELAAVLEE